MNEKENHRHTGDAPKQGPLVVRGSVQNLEPQIKQFLEAAAGVKAHRPDSPFAGLGQHTIADFSGCEKMPQNAIELEKIMLDTARLIGATVVDSTFHQFNPHGLSGVVVIAESHLAAHTWPEYDQICIDLFTCSFEMSPSNGLRYCYETFAAESLTLTSFVRGSLPQGQ